MEMIACLRIFSRDRGRWWGESGDPALPSRSPPRRVTKAGASRWLSWPSVWLGRRFPALAQRPAALADRSALGLGS